MNNNFGNGWNNGEWNNNDPEKREESSWNGDQTEAKSNAFGGGDESKGTGAEDGAYTEKSGMSEGGSFDGDGPQKPWYLTPSVEVPDGYNPYRDGETVFEETVKKHPHAFKGAGQLENEDVVTFYHRRRWEWGFARAEAKKSLGKSSMYIAGIILAYLFLINFFAICLQWAAFNDVISDILLAAWQYLFMSPALIILATIGQKNKFKTFFKKPQVSKFFIFKWCVIGLGITYAVGFLGNIFFALVQLLGVNVNDLSQPIPDTPLSLTIYFLTVVIGAPLFEELLFRGVFLTRHMKYGCWHAIIVTAVLFGLVHQNHQQMFFAAALGLIFGYIDVKAGSIIPSLIAHTVINLYSFLATFSLYFTNYNETFADPSIALDGPAVALLFSGILNTLVYPLMIVSVIMLVYEFKKHKSDLELPKGDSFLTEKEKNTVFSTHPIMVVLLVLLLLTVYLVSFASAAAAPAL